MATRRRKKTGYEDDPKAIAALPLLDTFCSVCLSEGLREQQRQSHGGPTCKFGHGGASGIMPSEFDAAGFSWAKDFSLVHGREIKTRAKAADPGFEVREGDRLTVLYHGAKLQIAKYNTVELDGGIYSRTLLPGDDPEEQWDRIHGYLERKALERARAKLRRFSEELHKAQNNVKTGTAYDG